MIESVKLTVQTAATDRTLLTLDELKTALGLSGSAQNDALALLNSGLAAALTGACNIATGEGAQPTLRKETLTQEFRPTYDKGLHYRVRESELYLARRPVTAVASVVEAGVTLDPASDYELDGIGGKLIRLNNGIARAWLRAAITVTYDAGLDVVPDRLKAAAIRYARLLWSEAKSDPLDRSIEIPGVLTKTRWIGAPADPAIPADVLDDLADYRAINF